MNIEIKDKEIRTSTWKVDSVFILHLGYVGLILLLGTLAILKPDALIGWLTAFYAVVIGITLIIIDILIDENKKKG